MASSTVKKVVVRRFDRENLVGFINPFSYLQALHAELLKTDGSLVLVPYTELRSICFVKDLETEPESGRIFLTRPKTEGLWVRMVFRDGEILDGVLPNDLLAGGATGFTITPPEPDGNNQKVFVPRQALRSIQVMGVVGSPLRVKRRKSAPSADQPTLF